MQLARSKAGSCRHTAGNRSSVNGPKWVHVHPIQHTLFTSRREAPAAARAVLPASARRPGVACAAAATSISTAAARSAPAVEHLPVSQLAKDQPQGTVVVWFKGDLRVDDHEGLLAVSGSGAPYCLPLYCIDPDHLIPLLFMPGAPEVLVCALRELRAELRARGSDLAVARGAWGAGVAGAVARAKAVGVVSEAEVELSVMEPSEEVLASLGGTTSTAKGSSSTKVPSYTWESHIWSDDAFKNNYKDWVRARGSPAAPKPAPSSLPPLPPGYTAADAGDIPTATELRAMLQAALDTRNRGQPAVAQVSQAAIAAATANPMNALLTQLCTDTPTPSSQEPAHTWQQRLAAYLSTSVPAATTSSTASASGSMVGIIAAAVKETEGPAAPGASFPALFGAALALGALSRRRVYAAATAAGGGRSRAALPAKAAATAAESADFHEQLAARNAERPPDMPPSVTQQHWRWRGFMTDFCAAYPPPGAPKLPADTPAILLVHGFGAFGDQWRGNLEALAAAGYTVYAPTFPGFGRSEKVAVPYSQLLWADFLRDFVVQVVGRPVVMAGNSIGGFISTSMAADYPDLVRGLVLLNSAGPIDKAYSDADWERQRAAKKAPPTWVVQAVSSGLFWYLERTVPGTLKWLYPTAPQRTEGWLATEISRAAADIGSVAVFASVFYLPPPKALNWLINERIRAPVMVLQGALDPLNDAKGRAAELEQLCPDYVTKVLLQAGHCPHDEVPEQVNRHLMDFIQQRVMKA